MVYFILPDLSAGGAERVSVTIARILKRNHFDVTFINLGGEHGQMYNWIVPEFDMVSFNCSRTIAAIPKLVSFMRSHENSLYFSSREHTNAIGLLCSKITGRTMVVRIPNMPQNKLSKGFRAIKEKIVKYANSIFLKSAKIIISQNKEMKRQLIEFYKLQEDKVVAINNPVDKEYILGSTESVANPFKEGEKVFLNVSNITYPKGIDILLKAWPIVKESIQDGHLYVVGRTNTPYATELMNSVTDRSDITFLGFQENPYPYLKYCDVFVLPSRMEGFPNVVLEAMCFNRPVVSTTCVEVIREIVRPGINGYYCPIENVNELAECMKCATELKDIDNQYALFDEELLLKCFKY